jgi:hypothetical protein
MDPSNSVIDQPDIDDQLTKQATLGQMITATGDPGLSAYGKSLSDDAAMKQRHIAEQRAYRAAAQPTPAQATPAPDQSDSSSAPATTTTDIPPKPSVVRQPAAAAPTSSALPRAQSQATATAAPPPNIFSSPSADDMIDSWERTPSAAGGSPPKPVDPLQNDIDIYTHAYALAYRANDQAAMQELHGHLLNAYQKKSARDNDPTAGQSGWQNFQQGIGRGMERIAKGAGNLVGLESDQDLKDSDALDKPLLNTTGGKLGDLTGQVAATLPLSLAGGAALGGATKALPAVGRGAAGLATRAGLAGAENAATSELGGGDAAEGAGLGAGLSVLGGAGGRLVRGLVQKSKAAQSLTDAAGAAGKDLFIPISQGADDSGISGLAGSAYRSLFPYALTVEGRLAKQSDAAKATLRDVAARNATPLATDAENVTSQLATPTGDTPQATAKQLKQQFDQQYGRIKKYSFDAPEDFHANVLDNLTGSDLPTSHKQQIASTLDNVLQDHLSEDGTLSGANLLRAKDAGREALGNLRSAGGLTKIGNPASTNSAMRTFDDMIDSEIKKGSTALQSADPALSAADQAAAATKVRDLQDYKNLASSYKEFKPYQDAVDAAQDKRGDFSFRTLARNSADGSANQRLGQDATEVLENTESGAPDAASWHGMRVLGGLGGAGAIAALSHPGAALATQVVPNVLSTKAAQKLLYGDTAAQKAVAAVLRNNPQAAYSLGFAGRTAANASRQQ